MGAHVPRPLRGFLRMGGEDAPADETALVQDTSPGTNGTFSVSQLSTLVKRTVETRFARVSVRGEIGRVSRPQSGHLYLDLKDAHAVLAGVIWRKVASRLAVQPEQGLEVVASGKLTTFAAQSKYQLVIDTVVPAGTGALMALLERRKAALRAEGLFDVDRKRPLPPIPRRIGVVTSPGGAVIRDILHRICERFPLEVVIWPVRVQGEGSGDEIARAIAGFDLLDEEGDPKRPDLIIVARGGGSLEDLWHFNDEAVVRAAAAVRIPLISAIGHETDTSLLDFAADLRAPTPSAAAELAVPVRADLCAMLDQHAQNLGRGLANRLAGLRAQLALAAARLPAPRESVEMLRQRFDLLSLRLLPALQRDLRASRTRLDGAGARYHVRLLDTAQLARRSHLAHAGKLLNTAMAALQDAAGRRLDRAGSLLRAMSHKNVLARGFALVRDADHRLIGARAGLNTSSPFSVEFHDGHVTARLVSGGEPAPPRLSQALSRPAEPGMKAQPSGQDIRQTVGKGGDSERLERPSSGSRQGRLL